MNLVEQVVGEVAREMDRKTIAEIEESMRPKPKPKTRRAWLYADGRKVYSEKTPDDWNFVAIVDEPIPVEPRSANRKERRAAIARERRAG